MTDIEKEWPAFNQRQSYCTNPRTVSITEDEYNQARDAILKVKELEEQIARYSIKLEVCLKIRTDLEAEVERLTKLACDRLVHKDLLTEYAKRAIELEEKNRKLVELCDELLSEITQIGCSEEFEEGKKNQLTELKL